MSKLIRTTTIALVVGAALWPICAFLLWRSPTTNCFWGLGSAECARASFSGFGGAKVEAAQKGSNEALMLAIYIGPTVTLLLSGVVLGVATRRRKNL